MEYTTAMQAVGSLYEKLQMVSDRRCHDVGKDGRRRKDEWHRRMGELACELAERGTGPQSAALHQHLT